MVSEPYIVFSDTISFHNPGLLMCNFQYKEMDIEGWETLLAISKADRFNRWMFETVQPYLKGNMLEIGSGIGNISQYFLDNKQQLTVSDLRENYLHFLRKKFSAYSNLRGIYNLDLIDPEFEQKHAQILNSFDSVFALNVIEHIENDGLALTNCKKLLKPGGTLLILVPAFMQLYNSLDRELFHFRRYSRSMLQNQVINAGFSIKKSFYFNALGIPAWIVGGWFSKTKTISSSQMNAYNKLIPLARIGDRLTGNLLGLSVITVATNQ